MHGSTWVEKNPLVVDERYKVKKMSPTMGKTHSKTHPLPHMDKTNTHQFTKLAFK